MSDKKKALAIIFGIILMVFATVSSAAGDSKKTSPVTTNPPAKTTAGPDFSFSNQDNYPNKTDSADANVRVIQLVNFVVFVGSRVTAGWSILAGKT